MTVTPTEGFLRTDDNRAHRMPNCIQIGGGREHVGLFVVDFMVIIQGNYMAAGEEEINASDVLQQR